MNIDQYDLTDKGQDAVNEDLTNLPALHQHLLIYIDGSDDSMDLNSYLDSYTFRDVSAGIAELEHLGLIILHN